MEVPERNKNCGFSGSRLVVVFVKMTNGDFNSLLGNRFWSVVSEGEFSVSHLTSKVRSVKKTNSVVDGNPVSDDFKNHSWFANVFDIESHTEFLTDGFLQFNVLGVADDFNFFGSGHQFKNVVFSGVWGFLELNDGGNLFLFGEGRLNFNSKLVFFNVVVHLGVQWSENLEVLAVSGDVFGVVVGGEESHVGLSSGGGDDLKILNGNVDGVGEEQTFAVADCWAGFHGDLSADAEESWYIEGEDEGPRHFSWECYGHFVTIHDFAEVEGLAVALDVFFDFFYDFRQAFDGFVGKLEDAVGLSKFVQEGEFNGFVFFVFNA